MVNIIMIFSYIVFWMLVIWFPPSIELPVTEMKDFEKYRQLTDWTKSYSFISSIAIITIQFRWIVYMAECYPLFGMMLTTIKDAIKDLILFSVTMLILMLGFLYSSDFLFNWYVPGYTGFIQTMVYGIFIVNENPSLRDKTNRVPYRILFSASYLIFILIFSFILVKLFISITIVRCLHLKSKVLINNEIKAKIIDRK